MKLKVKRIDPVLAAIGLLVAFLNIYGIWKDQYANAYYTAAVTSMLQSFHNFFFASFDPGGFVTVDKPPLAFWVQTLFAAVFGVHGWSVILPQALAGVGSVLLIYFLIKPSFGRRAARIASLIMACTPIAAAVSRSNNVDSLLVFTLLAATWMLFRAVKKGKPSLFIGSFALIGVAFNIKMLQAYMVLPAFYLFFWLAYKVNWKKKVKVLAASTAVMLALSFSWALIVDSIPQDARPYIGSSQTNSVLELAFGYNGVSRLTGQNGMGGGNRGGSGDGQMPGQWQQRSSSNQGGKQGGSGMFNTGIAGPLRLFQAELSGQISWMLPFALISAFGLLIVIRRKRPLTAKQKESLFWLAWLAPMMGFFSIAGFFHQYYLVMLAPAIAALAGTGWVELLEFNRNREGWKKWLLPVGILGTTAFQLYILWPYENKIGWGWPISLGIIGSFFALYFCLPSANKEVSNPRWNLRSKMAEFAAVGGLLVLLAGPLYWASTPLLYGDNAMMPAAGPQQTPGLNSPMFGQAAGRKQAGGQNQVQGQMQENVNTQLLAYLETHNTGEKFLFATTNAGTAEAYIINTGESVMAMGGFSGSDPILTVDKLKEMVANKEVKYFLLSGEGRGSSEVQTWIEQNGTEISQSEWQSGSNTNVDSGRGMNNSGTLYEVDP